MLVGGYFHPGDVSFSSCRVQRGTVGSNQRQVTLIHQVISFTLTSGWIIAGGICGRWTACSDQNGLSWLMMDHPLGPNLEMSNCLIWAGCDRGWLIGSNWFRNIFSCRTYCSCQTNADKFTENWKVDTQDNDSVQFFFFCWETLY